MDRRSIAVILTGLAALSMFVAAPGAHALKGAGAVDGDTIELRSGVGVRIIGIDTPEVGDCGAARAERVTARFIVHRFRLKNPRSVDDADRYDRLLRYVRRNGRDLGTVLIKRGLAVARYDSRDGYDWHPKQAKYHRLDSQQRNVCGFDPADPPSGGGDGGGGKPYFADCDAARAAGAAPVHRGDPGYGPHLDADGDGVACE